MGGTLDKLKNGGRDDVSRWRGVTVDDLRVVEVNWHNKRLKGSIPPLLAELDALRVLNLGGNDLSGELPEELGNMKVKILIWGGGTRLVATVSNAIYMTTRSPSST